MATKTSHQINDMTQVNIEDMDLEALLKEEAEIKARSEKIAEAKKSRADGLKKTAYTEIEATIKKYFDTVLTREEITTFLHENDYILEMVKEAPAGAKVGRRAINDSDILFSDSYTSPAGRQMKFKMDEMTEKLTGGSKDFFNTLKEVPFSELKAKFTKKFWEFAKTEDGKEWYQIHFANIKEDISKEINPEVKVTETETA